MECLLLGYFKEIPKTFEEKCSKKMKTLSLLSFPLPWELKRTLGEPQDSAVGCSVTTPPHSSQKHSLEQ